MKNNRLIVSIFMMVLFGVALVTYLSVSQLQNTQDQRSAAYEQQLNCVDRECTVSPIARRSKGGYGGPESWEPVYSNADFLSLEEALEAVQNQEGARLVLLKKKKITDMHPVAVLVGSKGFESRTISSSVHIRGEEAGDANLMPEIVAVVRQTHSFDPKTVETMKQSAYNTCLKASQAEYKPKIGNAINGVIGKYQLDLEKKGFYKGKGSAEDLCWAIVSEEYDRTKNQPDTYTWGMGSLVYSPAALLDFNRTTDSSLKGVVIQQRMYMMQGESLAFYDDIANMVAVVRVRDAKLDVSDCVFNSNWNTDVSEKAIPTSFEEIRRNRVVAMLFERSTGTVERTTITGSWAGGVLARDGSDVVIKHNQFRGRWFGVAGFGSNLVLTNNLINQLNPIHFMGDISPGGTGWQGLKAQYPEWIGPLPNIDYLMYGVWVNGGRVSMENNTIGQHTWTVRLENVEEAIVKNNLWVGQKTMIEGEKVGVTEMGSGNVVEENNMAVAWSPSLFNSGSKAEFGGSTLSGVGDRPIETMIPALDSVITQAQVGYTFGAEAEGWNNWKLVRGEKLCESNLQYWFPAYTCQGELVCDSGVCVFPSDNRDDEVSEQVPSPTPARRALPSGFSGGSGRTGR